ncbi:unnamed protein product [Rotaria sp. Silwood1]|nr:unnamed protein product [Rotaria sp. Silwood1]CAF1387334.1 unnamed protein product [Rotaria sp. Silwood1]CAF3527037.1 unnamed protein product [Rotaria sp. Silwood1]CAF3590639.1 unnamed protein product [Rotaria sp. Silwood1]CAF4549069.1 unnamed protein product [Rotaria sp. Silwood1]
MPFDTILLSRELVELSSNPNDCTNASQCLFSNECTTCENGRGPDCNQATCINGKCNIIKRCSQEILSISTETSLVTNQCKGTDASNCIFNKLCELCLQGYNPACTEAICVNDQCKMISPCSIYTPTTQSSTVPVECQNDGQCSYAKLCADECQHGTHPLCAIGKCVNNICQTILPCSQNFECTTEDLSQCVTSQICAQCSLGYSPTCAQATCENGQCKTIMPCSIFIESSTTVFPIDTCTRDDDCFHLQSCVDECSNDTAPLCTSVECVNGKCIDIKPCSQRICNTQATCPYNQQNCLTCPEGYGPTCEQSVCSHSICSIIPPCSKQD